MKDFTLIDQPTNDGSFPSDVQYNDEDWDLQTDCNDIADDLQTDCSDIADDLQIPCNGVADIKQPIRRLPPQELNPALVEFLAVDANLQKITGGNFSNVDELAKYQKTAPSYMPAQLKIVGFKDNLNVENITRYYIPAARVKRVENILGAKIKVWQKVSAVLAVLVFLLFVVRPSSRVEEGRTAEQADSAITWNELTQMLKVYNKHSQTKIWYAPPLYREINEKQIRDVDEIKKLFDKRAERIRDGK